MSVKFKLAQRCEKWKGKAVERGETSRYLKKENIRIKQERNRHKNEAKKLKKELKKEQKKNTPNCC